MNYRVLGLTGLKISEVGFGAWGIGKTTWIGADDTVSMQALEAARDAGINFFDTALVYGRGHSERLLGKVFGRSEDVVIATKAPPLNRVWPAKAGVGIGRVFPRSHVMDSLDQSLRNLGREAVDLFQFHVWSDEWVGDSQLGETLDAVRRSGKARYLGISVNDHQPDNAIAAVEAGLVDSVQVIYNLFDQSAEDALLPTCAARKIGVIARVPFDEGGLTGAVTTESHFPDGDFREKYFAGHRRQEVSERTRAIAAEAGIDLEAMPELALRFCLSHPAVTTVIAGMRTADHVAANVQASARGALEPELRRKLRRHRWIRDFYLPEKEESSEGSVRRSPSGRLRKFLGMS